MRARQPVIYQAERLRRLTRSNAFVVLVYPFAMIYVLFIYISFAAMQRSVNQFVVSTSPMHESDHDKFIILHALASV